MFSLQKNDAVIIYTIHIAIHDKAISWLSFKGFMYAPLHQLLIAWSVQAKTDEGVQKCYLHRVPDFRCKVNIITFNVILVNVGHAWSAATNEAIIPQRGLYYVTFVLLHIQCPLVASLLVNNVTTCFIIKTTSDTIGQVISRERAVLLNLEENDTLRVTIINGTVVTYSESFVSSFSEILVYPL